MFEQYLSQSTFSSYEEFIEKFRIIAPENFNFGFDVVDATAIVTPDKTALVWCDEDDNEATFTFADIMSYSNKTANYLQSLGIEKGDRVMIMLKRRFEYWFCLVALHKLGAIAIPANHLLKKKDLVYRNNAAGVKMIIACNDEHLLQEVELAADESLSLRKKVLVNGEREGWGNYNKAIKTASSVFARPTGAQSTTNNDLMLLYFTSGTTGMPKMVVHDFVYPLGHLLTAKYWQNVEDDGLHLTVSDTGWAKAAWGKIYGQWLCGSAIFVYDYDRFHPDELLKRLEKYHVTTFCAPPTILRFLIKEDMSGYDLSSLKHASVAGEPLNPEVYNAFYRATGLRLREGFGQTESVILLANYPWITPKPGSMGKPSPGYDIDLLNYRGEPCEVGEEGQIVIHTDRKIPKGLFKGYYCDPDLTASVWHDDLYFTGDMAWRDEDGYYWFVGRADDLIKTSGYRVGPFEVESALMEHPAVLECAVTGVPDPVRGSVVKAAIVLARNYSPSPELIKALQEHVKKVTAPYKYPRIIEFLDELPKTISGKIRRVEIRATDKDKGLHDTEISE